MLEYLLVKFMFRSGGEAFLADRSRPAHAAHLIIWYIT